MLESFFVHHWPGTNTQTHKSRTVTIAGHTKFLLPVAGTYVSPASQPVDMEDEETSGISCVSP